MAVLEIRHPSRVKPESAYLQDYCRDVTSQFGEDGIIEKIFETIGATNKCCVEFGAADGRTLSNTWRLLNEAGWRGALIEPENRRFEQLRDAYADRDDVLTLHDIVAHKGPKSLDALLSTTDVPRDLDLLSIDVDGMDWYIWGNLTDYRPRVVVIEFNHSIPNRISFIQNEDPAVNHGCSLLALIDLAKHKGYELVATTTSNALFVTKEDFGRFGITDNGIDAMHSVGEQESFLFQLYDGTMVLCGNTTLLWRQFLIHQEDIQVLPRALRTFDP